MINRPSLLVAALSLLTACAPMTDRVILLPGPGGQAGAVEVRSLASGATLRLDRPFAQAELRGGEVVAGLSSQQAVDAAYGELAQALPARPRSFVVRFEPGSEQLTADSLPVLAEALTVLARLPAAELVVTGHTDRVGTIEANDKLSLVRAQTVRELLVRSGVARELIEVAGRGERDPLIATDDEAPEPRNRRVDIKLR